MEVNASRVVCIEISNQVLELLLGGLEAEGPERDLELLSLDGARPGGVEQVEGLLDLLLLRLGQLLFVRVLLLLHILVALAVVVCGRALLVLVTPLRSLKMSDG